MAETGLGASPRGPVALATRRPFGGVWLLARSEPGVLIGLLLAIFAAFVYRLDSVIVSDMDEGTYLYAGKLLSHGLLPYRDFLLTHPPIVALLAAAWLGAFGEAVMPARLAYLTLILGSAVPLYVIARRLVSSRSAGLLTVATYMTGMLFLANMGRTIRLEPLMNAFLIAGVCAYFRWPGSLRVRGGIGALFALALLVKLVAVIPAGLFVLAELLWGGPRGGIATRAGRWGVGLLGAASIMIPAGFLLLAEPRFIDDVIRLQFERPGLPLETRLYYLWQDSIRYPVVALALVAAFWFVARPKTDARLRILSLVAAGSTVLLVFAFRTFFGYYLVQVLPWFALLFTAVVSRSLAAFGGRHRDRLLLAGVLVIGVGLPLVYDEIYQRYGEAHVSAPAPIVARLREGTGYLYTMYPSFALWSGRELYPSYYAADSLIARFTGRIGDDDFVRIFSGCEALVLWDLELADYPRARAYVDEHFTVAVGNPSYVLWERVPGR
jgi:hypothetical protein